MGNTSSNIHTVSSLKTWINCSILKHNDSLKQKVFYERMLSKYPVYWIQPTKLNLLTYAPSVTASFLTHPSGCLSVCMHSVAQLCWVFCTHVVQWVWWVFFCRSGYWSQKGQWLCLSSHLTQRTGNYCFLKCSPILSWQFDLWVSHGIRWINFAEVSGIQDMICFLKKQIMSFLKKA